MGKRMALIIALVSSLAFSYGGTVGNGPQQSSLESLYGTIAQAKEAQAKGITPPAITAIDAVVENPSTSTQPKAPSKDPVETIHVVATAYSSTPDQTDDTPFITASGEYVHDGIAAANFLPFGTKFKIPAYFGDKVFTVEDRMNSRYDGMHTIDIWFPSRQSAVDFGRERLTLELL